MHSATVADVSDVFDEIDAAIYLRIRVDILRALRRRGTGPYYMRIGQTIRYQRAALIAFQKSCTVEASAQDGAR
jgi:hypothetical protein